LQKNGEGAREAREGRMNCILLANGEKSRRLNRVKPFIRLGGKTVLEITLLRVVDIFGKIYIAATAPEKFKSYESEKVKVVEDALSCGPVGGIYSGLKETDALFNFVLACDNITVTESLVSAVIGAMKVGCDVSVAVAGGEVQPLFGIYSKNILNVLEERIKKRDYSVKGIFPEVNSAYIDMELKQSGARPPFFFNLNTPEDLREALSWREKYD
jgi:molybdenum cofactor guanylyltransferase